MLNDLRAAHIFSLGFSGLFRVGELLQLIAANVDIASSHLEITVQRSKTDQYGLGNKVFIAKTNGHACPHGLLSRYFALAGIFPHSDEYNFRAINSFKGHCTKPAINKPISYSRCREIIKETLAKVREDPQLYSTHSMRSGGTTAMAHAKTDNPVESKRLLRLQGRWRSKNTKDLYKKDSIANRLSLTKALNL